MRAREFIVEYNQQKTAQMFGKQIANTFNNGPDKRFIVDPNVIKDDDSIINYVLGILEDADPTPNKIYMPWLAREYAKGQIKRLEDADAYKPLLQIYEIAKKRRDFRQDAKDIMRLNATQFYTILKNYELPQAPMKDRGQAKEVYKDSKVRIIVPIDQQAACYYGQGTRWCTAATQGTNYFNNYNNRGKLYILLPQQPEHDGEKYQLHFGTDQYMDEEDDPVRIEYILKERFPELLSFFKDIEPKLSHYVVFADDKLLRSIGDKIEEMAMEHVSEMVSEWEFDDRGYREWQYDTALERGIIDPETMTDDEMWDRIHEEDDLNDYYRWNSEAEDFVNLMRNAVVMSVSEMKEYASDMSAEEYDGDGSPVDFQELDEVYKFAAHNYLSSGRRRDSYDIGDWIQSHVSIDASGNVKYVGR